MTVATTMRPTDVLSVLVRAACSGALLGIAKQDGDELYFSWLTEDDGELDKGADINESLI